ncbi:MAG: alpha/beta hydrolase [Patescibacteria group bacterium]|jgi:pimeloyl-ACP methyl ester carboxylesterase
MNIIQTPHHALAVYTLGDPDAEKLALVLPGRLDTKDYPHMRSHVDFLAHRGFFALSFDPPGTWESPGGIELYTMTNYLAAINELIVYFGNKPTLLLGHSRGGTMAMLVGTRNPLVTHFIAMMSNTGGSKKGEGRQENEVEVSYRDTPPNDTEHQKRFDLPMSYFKDAAQYNVRDALATCTKPKLFLFGTKDTIVKPEKVHAAYATSAAPKELRELDAEHNYRRSPEAIAQANEYIGEFLDTYGF